MAEIPRRRDDPDDADWRPHRRVDPEAWREEWVRGRVAPPWVQPLAIVVLTALLAGATTLALGIRQDSINRIAALEKDVRELRSELTATRVRQDWVIHEVARLRGTRE